MKTVKTNHTRLMPVENHPHHRRGVQNRLQNFGLTMVVMGASFGLYYLGLFGGVSGPLQPEHIGDTLAALGVSGHHLLAFFLLLLVISITWNLVYNGINRMLGRHMICAFQKSGEHSLCFQPILREKSDRAAGRYVCAAGHHCSEVRFHVVKKGTLSHFLWMMWMVFSAIVLYLS